MGMFCGGASQHLETADECFIVDRVRTSRTGTVHANHAQPGWYEGEAFFPHRGQAQGTGGTCRTSLPRKSFGKDFHARPDVSKSEEDIAMPFP